MKSMKNVKAVLLDLGGVLVELTGVGRLTELMGGGIDPAELSRRWNASKSVEIFESGRCDPLTFAKNVLRELNMDGSVTPKAFLEEFVLFMKGFYPGAEEILRSLYKKYTLACLSNTNSLQWDSMRERFAVDRYFHTCFLSFEIGAMKPSPEIYARAIAALGCGPEEIAYFDDSWDNVRAGAKAGLLAHRVEGAGELRRKLEELGVLF